MLLLVFPHKVPFEYLYLDSLENTKYCSQLYLLTEIFKPNPWFKKIYHHNPVSFDENLSDPNLCLVSFAQSIESKFMWVKTLILAKIYSSKLFVCHSKVHHIHGKYMHNCPLNSNRSLCSWLIERKYLSVIGNRVRKNATKFTKDIHAFTGFSS